MIDFENWVAEISSKYGVDIYRKTKENLALGCVPLKEGLEYARKIGTMLVLLKTKSAFIRVHPCQKNTLKLSE